MEPLTTATAFATIVSLIGQFRSEHSSQEQVDFNEFLEWLVKTQHDDIKALLETNTQAMIGIKAILNEDRDVILTKLESIDNALSSFSFGISGFSDLAEAINPNVQLSDQAISLLCQLEDSGGSKILEGHYTSGMALHILDGKVPQIEISDPRFIEDDLRTLSELGLLRHRLNDSGSNLYVYTRQASELIRSFKNKN
jgi:hypothetical protein